jgi:hypothetical protein
MRAALISAVLSIAVLSQPALASDDDGCTKAPKEQWLQLDQLKSKLTDQGYKVKDIEFEDGCAEAKVEDKDGKRAELKFDPVTAAVVKQEED